MSLYRFEFGSVVVAVGFVVVVVFAVDVLLKNEFIVSLPGNVTHH